MTLITISSERIWCNLIKRWISSGMILILIFVCCSCAKNQVNNSTETTLASLPEGKYEIYYIDSDKTEIKSEVKDISVDYSLQKEFIQNLYNSMMESMQLDQSDKLYDVELVSSTIDEPIVNLNFNSAYLELDKITEVLFRACLVKTMTQVAGVWSISIYINQQPLTDEYMNPVGVMSASDFVYNTGSDINSWKKLDVVLYFANASGDRLVQEDESIVYTSNSSVVNYVLEKLIDGPTDSKLQATIPKNTQILSVSVKDGICYVNFNNNFLNNTVEVKPYITIYSIVNSLSELSTINKVQISVNNSSNVIYRDSISLNTVFERNLDYISNQ